MRYKILIAALPLLLLGVVGITNQALTWGDWGGGGTYWGQVINPADIIAVVGKEVIIPIDI